MYYNPMIPLVNAGQNVADVLDAETYQLAVDDFYEEICDELATYGQMEDVQVLENLNDHMIGLVYVKYTDEEDAEKCLEKMHGRFYGGRQLHAEYSPVADFREARCRTYDDGGSCIRGAYCNFMHVLTPSKALMKHITMKHRFQPCTHGVGDMRTIGSSSGGSGGYHKGRTDGRDRDGGGGYDRYERSPESDRGRGGGGGGGGRRDRSRSRDRHRR
jgi:splicing factor U2AF subunit